MSDLRQLPKLIALLGSDRDGEVLGAARAIGRLLASSGASFQDLAQALGHGIAEQRFKRDQANAFDPDGERALNRWRVEVNLARYSMRDKNFARLPAQWQAVIRKVAESAPHLVEDAELQLFDRARERLGNWRGKEQKAQRQAEWRGDPS
jgi:hypothetical protein